MREERKQYSNIDCLLQRSVCKKLLWWNHESFSYVNYYETELHKDERDCMCIASLE